MQGATHIALPIVGLFRAEVEFAVVGGGREGDWMGDATGEVLVIAVTVHTTPLGRAVTLIVTCKWGQWCDHLAGIYVCVCVCVCVCICVRVCACCCVVSCVCVSGGVGVGWGGEVSE